MNKRITKKCIGALLASIVLTAYPVAFGRAQTTNTMMNHNTVWEEVSSSQVAEEQTRNASHFTNDPHQFNEIILLKVKELTEQGINLDQIQIEIQNMLKNINTDIQKRG